MATVIPATRGTFGNTEYYLTTMNVSEVLRIVRFPKDIPGWKENGIEERWQREINFARIRKEIAPYFAQDEARFSGAVVLAALNSEEMDFEPLSDFLEGNEVFRRTYRTASRALGFVVLSGEEVLVPLDGQHRLMAFRFAIDGVDQNGRAIEGIESNIALGKDDVAVILVRFTNEGSRRIFNKINRYAKQTVKGDNLITDDDDAMAVITRELLRENIGVLDSGLARMGSNALNKTAREFTTLATFYDANIAIVNGLKIPGSGKPQDMPKAQQSLVKEQIKEVWERLLSRIDLWAKAVSDSSPAGDKTRIEIREQTLLGKPIGQLSLVRAYLLMRERCVGVPDDELCDRLNNINWNADAKIWQGVLMNSGGRVMSGSTTVNRACEFIAHLGGAKLTDEENQRLREHIHGAEWEQHELPAPVA